MTYQPIESYALIGDMHTAALVGASGSIDWLCLPQFDSPSVFAAILDDEKGGRFIIEPAAADQVTSKQQYWPDTNVLVTRFLADHGAAELVDFMPVGERRYPRSRHVVVRRLKVLRGEVEFLVRCAPAFDYARARHETSVDGDCALFRSDDLTLALVASVPLERDGDAARTTLTLREGESATFCLSVADGQGKGVAVQDADALFEGTVDYWRQWLGQCKYRGRWQDAVRRSALALKLLTFEPTGATVAAPTMGLPEFVGGSRNWDYRYSWIRDSAFTIYSLLRLGFTEEASGYIEFLHSVCDEPAANGPLQLMYGIDGGPIPKEEVLEHLSGYRDSAPVRVGNAASGQLQLDIYGELIDAIYLHDKHAAPITYATWKVVRKLATWVAENWRQPDEGIWEVRGGRQHFVYSKLMCWVALDRSLRIARRNSLPGPVSDWERERDAIFEEIMELGWNEERKAFTQAYGSSHLDSSVLVFPLALFISPVDERFLSTLDALMKPRSEGGLLADHLVYRYDVDRSSDGLEGEEGTFNICTFWLVDALTRAGRYHPEYLQKARLIFEHMLSLASATGLFAEETGPRGEALGNYPQAFTHLSLITAAVNLDEALGDAP